MRNRVVIAAAAITVAACEHTPADLGRPVVEPASAIIVDRGLASASVSTANLIAHWDFDQGSGTTLPAVGGNAAYGGTLSSTPTWTAGRFGGALRFDGSDQVTFPNMSEGNGAVTLTLAGWIKRRVPGARLLLGKQSTNGTATVAIEAWSDGLVYFDLGTTAYAAGDVALNDTTWHHVALVYDGSQSGNTNRLKGYVDGVQRTLSWTGTVPSATTTSTTSFRLGLLGNSYSDGLIDDLWLFNRVLSPSEIQSLAQGSSDTTPPTVPAGLIATPVSSTQVNLSWSASTDSVGVAGYHVYKNGVDQGTTPNTTYSSTGLTAATTSSFTVSAFDAAGNTSAQSAPPVSATTQPAPPPAPVATVTVSPATGTVSVGGTLQLTATTRDSVGNVLSGRAVTWASGDASAASVSAAGVVTGVAPGGPVTVTATSEGKSGQSTITVSSTPPPPPGASYPLVLGPTGRYLVDQTGKPFLLVGDAAWSLIAQLSDQDADTYLANRQQLGFNLVLVNLLEHEYADHAPADFYGIAPFSGQAFVTPNEAYFAHADHVIQSAAQKGIVVLLAPDYVGYECRPAGWCAETQAATTAQMFSWGQYVGNRYKDYDNILWVVGGDTDPSPVLSKLQAMVDGIRSVDTRHLMTAHNGRPEMAIDPWGGASWLTVNNIYPAKAGTDYVYARDAYNVAPQKPFFSIESWYDGEGTDAQGLRSQSYGVVLMGGFGQVYGDCPIWGFDAVTTSEFCPGTSWQSELGNQGAQNMKFMRQLFESRNWDKLVPDLNHGAITAGYGTWGSLDYVPAALASDGSSIIAYLPTSRTVTVDGSALSGGSMTASWYRPGSGAVTPLGTYPTSSPRSFTPPSNLDWVLVVDGSAFGFGAPGNGPVTPPAPVATVTVLPDPGTVNAGQTLQLTATLRDANGTLLTGRVVTWTTSNAALATVSSSGLVTGVAAGGPVTITATSEGQSDTSSVTVVQVPVATVTVSPNPGTVSAGQTLQLSATTRDANGNVLTGRAVTWTTSDASLATVSSSGLVSGVAVGGPVTITATSEGQSGTSAVTVVQVPVATVTVSPNPGTVTAGQTLQLTATTRDANGNVLTGRTVTWSTSNSALATVSSSGLVSGVAAGGPVTITATSEGKSGTSSVTVAQVPVATVTVSPNPGSVNTGQTLQLSATTRDANGNVLTGRTVTWTTSNSGLATVSSNGLVSGVAAGGPVTITATSEGQSGTSAVTVIQVPVATVTVSPNPGTVTAGQTMQLSATTRDANGNVLTGRAVTWTTSDASLATVSSSGLVTGVAVGGPVTIAATSEGQSGTSAVTVVQVPVATVTVSPNPGTVTAGQTLQLTATTRDANGNVLTGRTVAWTTSNSALATVSSSGLVTGVAAGGPVTITASSEGKSGTSSVTVAPIPVATVTVSPNPGSVNVGQTLQLSATTRDANGNVLTGRVVTWTTSNSALATVSSSGLVTGVAAGGPVTITATSEGKSGTSSVTVVQVPVATVTVSPNPGSVNTGQTLQLSATTRDANGNVLTGRTVTWTTSNAAIATVNSSGLVSGVAAGGPVTITATSEGHSGTSSVTVAAAPSTIAFVQATAREVAGSSVTLTLPAAATQGNLIVVGLDFASSNFVSISDNRGNTYTQVGSEIRSNGGAKTRLYYAKNVAGGSTTITVSLTASTSYLEVYGAEYRGANATNPLEAYAQNTGSSSSVTSGNLVTANTNDLLFAYCVGDSRCTVGSGFTARSTFNNNLLEDRAIAAAGTYAATATATSGWSIIAAAFKR